MKSKTLIAKQMNKKTNSELVNTILLCKKNKPWLQIAAKLSGPSRKRANLNLDYIDKNSKDGEAVVVAGKVLSQGDVSKKIKVVAFSFSATAREKLLNAKCDVSTIVEEIKKNPKGDKIKILG